VKVIIDTNIIVNVFLSPNASSASYKIFEMCLMGELIPQMGCALYSEYEDVINRTSIQEKANYTRDEIEKMLDGFFSQSAWVKTPFLWRPNLEDEGDNHLIDLAVASNTEWIITQNIKDLNSGELKFSFQCVSPGQFLEIYHGNNHL